MARELFDFVKEITSWGTTIVALIGVFTFLFKPLRNKFINWIQNTSHGEENAKLISDLKDLIEEQRQVDDAVKKDIENNKNAMQCMLRIEITHTYYRYLPEKHLPTYQRENLINSYEAYKGLGGNGFIKTIYEDMMNWEVVKTA